MEKDILQLIADSLEIPVSEVYLNSTSNDFAEWDSLGHLTILQQLDLKYDNITDKAPELASASTVKEIVDSVISKK
jgi:acyl carrier protein